MDLFHLIYLIGAISLFLYGMKLMSEGLQKIAGDRLRNIYAAMTDNRFSAMLTGVLVTSLVLSSSTTMVMIVSFVNSGLVSLAESLAVVMGANLGASFIYWIIAILGFTVDFGLYILPIIAIALPLYQSSNSQRNSWGELLIGFALIFFSIGIMKETVPNPTELPILHDSVMICCDYSYLSVLLFLTVGVLITLLLQTSSVTFTLALLLCVHGWITFYMGCAILLGMNIGTCLSPLLISRKASGLAKRSAFGFLAFNAIGSLWAVILFFWFCEFILYLCKIVGIENPNNLADVSIGLALFYTVYNLINIFLMLPFTKQIVKYLERKKVEEVETEEPFKLQYLSKSLVMPTGQMALIQMQKETSRYANEVHKMFSMIICMVNEPLGSERQILLHQQISQMESDSDRAEMDIADFLNQVSHKSLSWEGELLSRNLYKMVDELESIADSILHMSTTLINKQEQRVFFSQEMNTDIRKMLSLTDTALTHMCRVLDMDEIPSNALNKAYNHEDEINNYRNLLRNAMLERIDLQQIEYMQSTYFMLLVNECEKIGDYALNVVAAACES